MASAQETPTNGNAYYIYNADNDLFFTRGADWGTQAIASPVGIPWKIEISDGKYTLKMYDINTQNNADIGLGFNGSYTDNGSPIALTPSGNATDGFTLENGGDYITCPASKGVVSMTSTASKWKFLTQTQYDAVLASRASAQETAVATSKGITIPGGKTLNEVVSDVNTWASSTTVDALPTKAAWTKTGGTQRSNYYNEGAYGVELFESNDAHISKTISGLASGIYKVSVRGMRRVGTNDCCVALKTAGFRPSDVYMEANGNIIPFKAWADDNTANNNPDSPAQAVDIINNGGYTNDGFVYVGNDGKLTLTAHVDAFWWGCWFVFNGVSYTFYNNEVSDEEIATLVGTIPAEGTVPTTVYTNLTTLKNTLQSDKTIAAYNALNTAVTTALELVAPYASLVAEIAKAKALGVAAETADAYATVTTAAEATANTHALMVDEYNYVTTNYQYGVALGTWTTVNAGDRSGQHWDGTGASTYSEQDEGWSSKKWSCSYSQNIDLPAGKYVFKVAGRKCSDNAVLTLTVKNGPTTIGTVNDFPNGDTGKGIDTSGATNFGDGTFAYGGTGRGWQWRYVQFTLDAPATVTIAVEGKVENAEHQWVGFCNPTVQTDNEANISLIAYNIALNDANTAFANDDYKNVTGSEKTELQAAIAADGTLDKANKDAIDAAKTTLVEKTTAFTGAKAAYDDFVAAKAVKYEGNLPYASATKFAAIATAQGAAAATSKSDAETKANAILSAYRKYVESNALAEGVVGAQQIDITDPDMDVVYDSENHKFGVWQVIGQTNGTINLFDNESFTDGDGKNDYKYANIQKNDNNAGIQQTVNLDEGKYLLTVTARAQNTQDAAFWVFGDDNRSQITRIGNSGGTFGRGWNDFSVEFYVLGKKDVNIGVQSGNGKNMWWSATRFRLMRIGDAVESVTVTPAGYATYVSTLPLDYTSTEIKAYTAKANDGKIVLTQINKVPANTPVVLYKEGGATENIPVAASTDTPAASDLVAGTGAAVATAEGDYTNYILNVGTKGIGFYRANSQTVAANRAYMHVSNSETGSMSRMAIVFDNQTTGIANLKAAADGDDAIYNLNGQRIEKATKGVYIIDGKKIIMK